jgi:hypothetical protein
VEPPASPQSAIDTEDPPANTVITLQRGGCERRCAVYRIVIFADGTAIYEGRHYVRKTGVVVEKLEISAVRSLIEAFRSIDYFALRSDYGYGSNDGCESEVLDEPIAMTSIVVGTQSKAIVHHHRCIGPVPTKLRELEDEIDRALNSVRWIR